MATRRRLDLDGSRSVSYAPSVRQYMTAGTTAAELGRRVERIDGCLWRHWSRALIELYSPPGKTTYVSRCKVGSRSLRMKTSIAPIYRGATARKLVTSVSFVKVTP